MLTKPARWVMVSALLLAGLQANLRAQDQRTNQPDIMLSVYRTMMASRVDSTFNTTRSILWVTPGTLLPALKSEAVTDSGGDWLSATNAQTAENRTKAMTVSAKPAGLTIGTYTGRIRFFDEAGNLNPAVLDVTYVIYPDTANVTSPVVTYLDKQEYVWGERSTLGLNGLRIPTTGVTIVVEPADGVAITNTSSSATFASATLKIFDGATEGERNVYLTTATGETNRLKINIRQQTPFLVTTNPKVLHQGRIYAYGLAPFDKEFRIAGMDLGGVEQLTGDGFEGVSMYLLPDAAELRGFVTVDNDAPAGRHDVTLVMPVIATMGISFEVQPPPPNAPQISDLQLEDSFTSGNQVVYRGKFKFKDLDGDIEAKTMKLRFIVDASGGYGSSRQFDNSGSGSTITVTGTTEGEISFEFRQSYFLATRFTGNFPVAVTLVDAQGNLSNAARVSKTQWIAVLI